eukprot:TRINITY_DN27339_c0_g1_i1.p1 TRINITY_DN27339_c0_g1~~TRINITY_DN27339_c0_g1_i1.p1  ORF type:complete len:349 (+),score=55.74 TRINITY_DN27339_c0_g1_i1:109-1155(+)
MSESCNRLEVLTEMFRIHHNTHSTPFRSLTGEVKERTIWSYWAQGEDAMPDLFKLFVKTWKSQNPSWDVRVLDRSTVFEYLSAADLPNRFQELLSAQSASDCVRLALLARYGGVWMDVSILLKRNLDEMFWTKIESDEADAACFYHPRYGLEGFETQNFTESWLLATKSGNPFFLLWRDLYKELLHNRLDVTGLCSHPLYQGLDLSGFKLLQEDFRTSFDFREYLAIHVMFHRILETNSKLRSLWLTSWIRLDAAATAFKIQLRAESEGENADATDVARIFLSGEAEIWDSIAEDVPLIKFTTPHHSFLSLMPAEVLLDDRGLLGRILSRAGAHEPGSIRRCYVEEDS